MKGATPFPAVHVTPAEAHSYRCQVRQLLDETLRDFDAHVTARASGRSLLLDKWQWKRLKSLEGLCSYQERHPTHPQLTEALASRRSSSSLSQSSLGSLSSYASAAEHFGPPSVPTNAVAMAAFTPELTPSASSSSAAVPGASSVASVAVEGQLPGPLDDVMYGLAASDTAALHLRESYMPDPALLDAAVLCSIDRPSATTPFQCLGIHWLVRGAAARSKAGARRPRDFVVVVASGVVRHRVPGRAHAQAVGYALRQSIERSECGTLEARGLTRGWLSSCALFTAGDGRSSSGPYVDVFARAFADFKGSMQDHQAASKLHTYVLAGLVDAAACGQSKKLGRLLAARDTTAAFGADRPTGRCAICDRKFGVLSPALSCDLCRTPVCSRCRVARDLSLVKRSDAAADSSNRNSSSRRKRRSADHAPSGWLEKRSVTLCKNCKVNASHADARVVARQEAAACDEEEAVDDDDEADASVAWTPGRRWDAFGRSKSDDSVTGDRWSDSDERRQSRCSAYEATASVRGSYDDRPMFEERTKTSADLRRSDSGKSFASTLPVADDQDREEAASHRELARLAGASRPPPPPPPPHLYLQQQQLCYQPRYGGEAPELSCTSFSRQCRSQLSSSGTAPADLMRRMQELQMNAESVYQFTSKMNASTRFRHEPLVDRRSILSISELD
ncbi:unnamed protein product [Hyaloperonospora brassicae]|uniref:FYVE-type domain-containing protein n=1 Tax=Hyaloperonospora brassicae TaxID=162125 RepID=A0AAV0UGS2_HYABA|nr:unnamed protein product [Hyaloperonospora brassicae]